MTAPETIRPPVLKKPIKEIRRAESASVNPLCCVIYKFSSVIIRIKAGINLTPGRNMYGM